METRWLSDEEIERDVNPCLAARGMAQLNLNPAQPTCRVAGCFQHGVLIRAFAMSLFPVLGPLVETDSTQRDDGSATRAVVEFMTEFLLSIPVRGALTIADSPISARLAERFGMTRVQSPVFFWNGSSGDTATAV